MKDHVEIGHLTKYDAFRMNRDQVMDLEIWFKIHTNVLRRNPIEDGAISGFSGQKSVPE